MAPKIGPTSLGTFEKQATDRSLLFMAADAIWDGMRDEITTARYGIEEALLKYDDPHEYQHDGIQTLIPKWKTKNNTQAPTSSYLNYI